jgi:hypothetical protein
VLSCAFDLVEFTVDVNERICGDERRRVPGLVPAVVLRERVAALDRVAMRPTGRC